MESQKDFLKRTGYLYSKKTDTAWSNLHNRIEQDQKIPEIKPHFYTSWVFRIAASLILLVGIAWGIREMTGVGVEKVETAFRQRQVTLPDGTIAFLNSNSHLTYPKKFRGDKRTVSLSGEVFFKVSKNPLKPFIIETKIAQIKVLGTSFNVQTTGNDRVEVLVKTGIVRLSSLQNTKNRLYLRKGDYGVVEAGAVKTEQAPGVNYLSWQTKKFQFNNDNLKDVTRILSHAYARKIVLASDSLDTALLTSTYNQASLNTIIQSLCLAFHLKATQNNNEIVLSPAN